MDAAHLPPSVTLTVVMYDAPGRTRTDDAVTLRVRDDSPAHTLRAWATDFEHMDIWDFQGTAPRTLSVTFDPAPAALAGAVGLVAELSHGYDLAADPFFTTDWEVYRAIDEIDLDKDAYALNYSSYGHWPYCLRITYREVLTAR